MIYQELVNQALNRLRLSSKMIRSVKEERRNYSNEEAPIIKLVDNIIETAIEKKASDIHFEPVAKGLRIRLRIDGELEELYEPLPLELMDFVISRIKVLAKMDIAEHRIPQDGRFLFDFADDGIDIRVSVLPLINGEKIVMRILNDKRNFLELNAIGMTDDNKEKFYRLIESNAGAIIIAGPVNSGKTTTLYAALNEVASEKENVITIEDPVEYKIEGINQIQVNPKAGLTFNSGLRASLRQDTDLIMVGEIRDVETASLAIRGALTGHLLFTTLHTATALEAFYRLMDMGIKRYMLLASIKGIVAQRLVKKLCPKCRKRYKVTNGSYEEKFFQENKMNEIYYYKAEGCEECNYTGYKGRIAIHEILTMNDEFCRLFRNDNAKDSLVVERELRNKGMKTLWDDGIGKMKQGFTTLSELRRVLENGA